MKIFSVTFLLHSVAFTFNIIGYGSAADFDTNTAYGVDENNNNYSSSRIGGAGRSNGGGGGGGGGDREGGGRNTVGDVCNESDITKCVSLLEVLTNRDLGFAASVDEIGRMCPVLLDGLRCIDNYTLRCLSPEHRNYFNKLYAGTITVIKDLCNSKGPYQKEYLRHAPCMRQVNPAYNHCSEVYHSSTAGLNNAIDELPQDQKAQSVITLCCSFQEYLQCSERVVLDACGSQTAAFTKDFLGRMAGPIVQSQCANYVPGTRKCEDPGRLASSSSSSFFRSSVVPPAFCFLLLLLLHLLRHPERPLLG